MKISKEIKYIGISIFTYLFLFYLIQFINPPISWYTQALITAVAVVLGSMKLVSGDHLRRFSLGIVSIFMAFVISFIYSNLAAWHASDLCSSYIAKKMDIENIENKLDSNGLPTIVNLKEQCASEYLPFPWLSKAKI